MDAMGCEILPIPYNSFPDGSIINYVDEITTFGSNFSYCATSGIVLYSWLGVAKQKDNTSSHVWTWIVKPDNCNSEVLVQNVLDNSGYLQQMSLAKDKFSLGFSEIIRQKNNRMF
jgi:hypothetical protein